MIEVGRGIGVLRLAPAGEPELVRTGLAGMLGGQPGIEVTDLRAGERVHVALYDPDGPQAERRREALVKDPSVARVAAYTWNFQPWVAGELFDRGVSGYLAKTATATELAVALRRIAAGATVIAPTGTHAGTGGWTGSQRGLTPREAELLSLVAAGHSNLEIARRMNVSINSVKSYIRSGYRKIGVDSRSQAVRWALQHGLHDQGGPPATGPA